MFNDLSPLVNIIYMILLGGAVIGGFLSGRKGRSKETQEALERLNETLDGEIKVLRRRVDDLEKERATQDRVIATIRYALRQNGTRITIAGDFVTLSDRIGTNKVVRIQDKLPVHPVDPDDDDDTDAV